MTGFGRADGRVGGFQCSVEIKSVNHRYLDLRFRLPPVLSIHESYLFEKLRSEFDRGSFEINVRQRLSGEASSISGSTRFVVDETAAQSFMESCEWLHKKFKTEKIPSLKVLALTNKILIPIEETTVEGPADDFKLLFVRAVDDLKKMRESEGSRLKAILKSELGELNKWVGSISALAPQQPKKIQERLMNRIAQWSLSQPVDSNRLEWEVAFYAERSDITEELERLKTHVGEYSRLLDAKGSLGRKLEFLTQELHREINTLGAKTTLIEITKLVVESKNSIEKLREQAQNVE